MELVRRFLKVSNQDFFLFGPRGTGKSTWLKMAFREAFFVDLLFTSGAQGRGMRWTSWFMGQTPSLPLR